MINQAISTQLLDRESRLDGFEQDEPDLTADSSPTAITDARTSARPMLSDQVPEDM
jgi:hypothetical protein